MIGPTYRTTHNLYIFSLMHGFFSLSLLHERASVVVFSLLFCFCCFGVFWWSSYKSIKTHLNSICTNKTKSRATEHQTHLSLITTLKHKPNQTSRAKKKKETTKEKQRCWDLGLRETKRRRTLGFVWREKKERV